MAEPGSLAVGSIGGALVLLLSKALDLAITHAKKGSTGPAPQGDAESSLVRRDPLAERARLEARLVELEQARASFEQVRSGFEGRVRDLEQVRATLEARVRELEQLRAQDQHSIGRILGAVQGIQDELRGPR
jgi:exonuclease VII small subunit